MISDKKDNIITDYTKENISIYIITISSLIGIILGKYNTDSIIFLLLNKLGLNQNNDLNNIILLVILWIILSVIIRIKRNQKLSFISSCSIVLFFALLGYSNYKIHNTKRKETHYSHYLKQKNTKDWQFIEFQIQKNLKPSSYYYKQVVNIKYLNEQKTTGKAVVYLPKNTYKLPLDIDKIFLTYGKFKEFKKAEFPFGFDYQKYMNDKQYFHKINIDPYQLQQLYTAQHSLKHKISTYQSHILEQIQKSKLPKKIQAYIKAITLGIRHEINKTELQSFKNSGILHFFALSGLHIGIWVILLQIIGSPLRLLGHRFRWIHVLFMLIGISGYILLTQMTPSIIRAGILISFIIIGRNLGRKYNTKSAIISTLFIHTLYDPYSIFSVGFQFSYIAVFSIIWLFPLLKKRIRTCKKWLDKIIISPILVSISAQIGLFPLILYYFNEFPPLFLISNIILLPFITLFLVLGFICILSLIYFNQIPLLIMEIETLLYELITKSSAYISNYSISIMPFIKLDLNIVLWIYLILISTFIVPIFYPKLKKKLKIYYYIPIMLLGCIMVYKYLEINKNSENTTNNKKEIVVFKQYKNTIISVGKNQKLTLFVDKIPSLQTQQYIIKPYIKHQNYTKWEFQDLSCFTHPEYWHIDGRIINKHRKERKQKNKKQYLAYKKSRKYKPYKKRRRFHIEPFTQDLIDPKPEIHRNKTIILTHSPKINLERLLIDYNPKQIIADGSNYTSYIKRWKESCKQAKIPLHITREKGSFWNF